MALHIPIFHQWPTHDRVPVVIGIHLIVGEIDVGFSPPVSRFIVGINASFQAFVLVVDTLDSFNIQPSIFECIVQPLSAD